MCNLPFCAVGFYFGTIVAYYDIYVGNELMWMRCMMGVLGLSL